jgi:hypothetical protein
LVEAALAEVVAVEDPPQLVRERVVAVVAAQLISRSGQANLATPKPIP